ncbi:hypothetical protein SDRG_04538 [Saprolegnia diclina VS20]|uniref:Tyrosinase copper-binding domain-containing protein n=1 Tax=Saprolegnia diclina (strain VS20) TaxID=1156394 RepID=T0RZX0_SAPDV|nr:hypothetical protein SDRG_04538 [Saprolegnia diclina VS20]EQC38108.1 hypothetical protein SDRG_04538 [Saprolegnia diclina VS20]|eukprot:XP_008608435.1 hypothetical protein SDRG_04538 [Saprolegnia diclina VS20]
MVSTSLLLAAAGLAFIVSSVDAACPARVRKSWNRYSVQEKATYKKAVAKAMDTPLYERFISMHSDQMSNTEAHGTCVFLFWHRKFLLGYENMLRSMGSEFACVTLPYYDYVQDNLGFAAKSCATIEACSSLLRDMGGSSGRSTTIKIQKFNVQGNCVATEPVNHFCESTASCTKCVPRGPWSTTKFGADVGFASIKKQIFKGTTIAQASAAIELAPHGSIHGTLSSTMNNIYISPTEPVFYSHHAMIDALQTIYLKCRVRDKGITSGDMIFQGCQSTSGTPITGNSKIAMRVVVNGKAVPVDDEPSVKGFFAGLPTTYMGYTDATRLNAHSYAYEFTGLLSELYDKCENAGTTPTPAPRRLDTTTNATLEHATLSAESCNLVDAQTYLKWSYAMHAAGAAQHLTSAQVDDDIEKVRAAFYDDCLQASEDFTPEFKAMWHFPARWDVQVLKSVKDGSRPIQLQGWADLNMQHFGCRGDATIKPICV